MNPQYEDQIILKSQEISLLGQPQKSMCKPVIPDFPGFNTTAPGNKLYMTLDSV